MNSTSKTHGHKTGRAGNAFHGGNDAWLRGTTSCPNDPRNSQNQEFIHIVTLDPSRVAGAWAHLSMNTQAVEISELPGRLHEALNLSMPRRLRCLKAD